MRTVSQPSHSKRSIVRTEGELTCHTTYDEICVCKLGGVPPSATVPRSRVVGTEDSAAGSWQCEPLVTFQIVVGRQLGGGSGAV